MPVLKNRVAFEVARGIKAFLNVELGLIRGETPGAESGLTDAKADTREKDTRVRQLGQIGRRLAGRARTVAEPAAGDGAQDNRVRPENMIWIFGSGRSGSTWLRSMMSDMERHRVWEEPMVGQLFGVFHKQAQEGQLRSANFIMGEP
ncbi:MAG: hypothetical protein ACR2HO_08750, partial [Rubrobacteraceae bacterium]